ncbi:MAG: M42 family metallopeptidase, partial [Eubacteriales bacterium]|nr:M42 family metallopeptidase [Eubacteriales bacterium]
MDFASYGPYILEETAALLAIDSPSGMTQQAAQHVIARCESLGFAAKRTRKDGVLVDLGGRDRDNAILLEAHMDTLGGMVCEIKSSGRLRITNIGGLNANNVETENCRIITKGGAVYEGTAQLCNASIHVNGDYKDEKRTFDSIEIVIDEPVKSAEDVKKLGVRAGDYVCFDPRTRITKSGYIKSRFLDDKLSVGVVMAYAKYLKDAGITPERAVYVHVTSFEEVGHGGSTNVPEGVTEAISVDMGCVGVSLECDEHMVSICAKDSGGPYHYDVVRALIAAAEETGAAYAVDVYPHYGSD